ncbi:MAG: hypothetical protein U0Q55_11260 [Vicinamibacterales bacterium]
MFTLEANNNYELLLRPFTRSPQAWRCPSGLPLQRHHRLVRLRPAAADLRHRLTQAGHFYNGDITAVGYSGGASRS